MVRGRDLGEAPSQGEELGMKTGLAAALALVGAAPPAVPDVNDLGWMAGCWEQRDGDRWTEECWTAPRGGLMLGGSRAGRGDSISEWESLRI
jgi:hypothetical protein